MHHHACMRRGVALADSAGAQQELAHAGCQSHRDRGHVVGHPLHGVEDCHPSRHRATGRVDVEPDVLLRVLRRQEQQLGADSVGIVIAHLGTEEDDPLLEQAVIDVVV